jgi:hypothetical protein
MDLSLSLSLSLSLQDQVQEVGVGSLWLLPVFISFAGILYVKWSSKMLPRIYSMVDEQ